MVDIHNHLSKLQTEIAEARVALDPDKFENLSAFLAVAQHLDMAFLLTGEIAGAVLPMQETEVVVQFHAGPEATRKEAITALNSIYSRVMDEMPLNNEDDEDLDDLVEDGCADCEHYRICAGLTE